MSTKTQFSKKARPSSVKVRAMINPKKRKKSGVPSFMIRNGKLATFLSS